MKFSTIAAVLAVFLLATTLALSPPGGGGGGVRRRHRRTLGPGNFINCLAIGESAQRICSHSLDLLDAIERQQAAGNRSCPEGKVFHRHCNVCKCRRGGAFECSADLCAEDFFHPTTGLPRFW